MGVVDIVQNISYQLTVTIGGTDVSQYVQSFEFNEQLGQKATATLKLLDVDSNGLVVRPGRFGPNGGSVELHPHNLTNATPVIVILAAGGMPSEYPAFLISDVDFDGNGLCTVSLEDYHALLEQDGVSLTDIMTEAGDEYTAHSAIQEMTAAVGILSQIGWPDYPINELRRQQGSRLGWINQLELPYQGYTKFVGGTLHSQTPGYTEGPEFTLTDYINLTNLSWRETTAGHKNKFLATRLQPGVTRNIGEARGTQVGRNSQTEMTLDPPARSASFYKVKAEQGDLIDVVWWDENDNPLHVGPTYSGATPAAKCIFTYIYTVGTGEFSPEFHAYALGAAGQPSEFDTGFSATSNNTGSEQGYYGVRTEFTPLEDPAWPTQEVAQAACNYMALENANQRILSNWSSWLNPRIRAGTNVAIVDWTLRETGNTWITRSAKHTYVPGKTAKMEIGCSRRRS